MGAIAEIIDEIGRSCPAARHFNTDVMIGNNGVSQVNRAIVEELCLVSCDGAVARAYPYLLVSLL